ncbi:hypothetical protein [Streptomyces sp. NPDC058326]|uniref:hypothetical protein n=1 Tax=Streptomyces sp. NPDC058326 TaxID=3346447 RepID=UPI0036E16681
MTRTPTKNRWRKLAFACAVSALAVGCTTNEPTSQKPPSTPSGSTTPATTPTKTEPPVDPVEAAKKEAIATYLSHWKEVEKRYADKTGKAGDLKKYAAAVAQIQVEKDAEDFHKRGLVTTGTITVGSPAAVSADINRKVPKVVLSSCLDITQWQTIHGDTGKPATMPSNRLLRYVIKATVEKWEKGWVVIQDDPQGKKC